MGSRLTASGTDRVYAAAGAWVERALRSDDSLFTPGKPIWSKDVLGEVRRRFLDRPDESRDGFQQKLQRQLEGSPPEVYQLMGEVLYVYFLIVKTQNSATEQRDIDEVLGWSPAPVAVPSDLVAGLTPGILNPGRYFSQSGRPYQTALLIELAEHWKELEPEEQSRLLSDPWEFKRFAMRLKYRSEMLRDSPNRSRAQRESLFHLVFPDAFEAIAKTDDKEKIAKAFSNHVTHPAEDVDRQLKRIRSSLESKHGSIDYFFREHAEIRIKWDDDFKPWDEFVKRARRYVRTGKLQSEEIDYKIEASRKLAAVRQAVVDGDPKWPDSLEPALEGINGNPINWRGIDNLSKWCARHTDEALRALRVIWAENDSSAFERLRDFSGLLPSKVISGAGTRLNVASGLLMGLDAHEYPPFAYRLFNRAYDRTGYGRAQKGADEVALYKHALAFLDRFIEEASKRDLKLRDRLDAQSIVWAIRRPDDGEDEDEDEDHDGPWSPANIEALAKDLLWQPAYLQKIIAGLQDKRQAIFQGPPGTGKTYVAKRIAEHCRDHGGDFKIVQFHPSYSYEDFVEGFRPTLTEGGQAGFQINPGPLRQIAEEAAAKPEATFILVIDEINRGNVAKILGELYFLLEYRDEEVNLQYSNNEFSLPTEPLVHRHHEHDRPLDRARRRGTAPAVLFLRLSSPTSPRSRACCAAGSKRTNPN